MVSGAGCSVNRFPIQVHEVMRRSRRGGGFHQELGGSGEDSFVAVVVTKLTGALLFILLLTMVIMALVPKADEAAAQAQAKEKSEPGLILELPESLPEAIAGRAYQYTFSVRGSSTGKLQWSITEPMPAGLVLNAEQGSVYGQISEGSEDGHLLTVQVTDGQQVASGQTRLPVWNPKVAQENALKRAALDRANTSLKSWFSQGFGLAMIWLGHLSGLGVIHRLESGVQDDGTNSNEKGYGRFRGYRLVIWLMSFLCSGIVLATMFSS